jgi:hypothetical protein
LSVTAPLHRWNVSESRSLLSVSSEHEDVEYEVAEVERLGPCGTIASNTRYTSRVVGQLGRHFAKTEELDARHHRKKQVLMSYLS